MGRSLRGNLLVLAALPALAQEPLWEEPGEARGWNFRAGGMLLATPAFPGSATERLVPMPFFRADYEGRLFLGTSLVSVGAGAGLRLMRGTHLSWDLGLGLGERRPEARADELAGMGDRQGDAFLGTTLRIRGGAFHASASLASGLVQSAGFRGTLGLGAGGRIARGAVAGLGFSGTWGSPENLTWDFGVTPAQAARRAQLLAEGDSRLRAGEDRAYAPRGGLRETAATAWFVAFLSPRWQLFGVLRAGALQGEARRSPLVRREGFATGGFGFSARF